MIRDPVHTEWALEEPLTEVDWARAAWRKSSRSGADADCVEVAWADGTVAVRDSKQPGGPMLLFTRQSWRAFIDALKEGDLPEKT